MNADEFYEDLKKALDYLGLAWGQKHWAEVWMDGNRFCLAYGGRVTQLLLPCAGPTPQPPAPPTTNP